MKNKHGIGYIEHEGKSVVTDERFQHVMAIALDPETNFRKGIVRCITAREGKVNVSGYIDRSVIHHVEQTSQNSFKIGERLIIKNQEQAIRDLMSTYDGPGWEFIGLEDPDLWRDELTGLIHVYFTLPLLNKRKHYTMVSLGHAVGKDLNDLEMTAPVISADLANWKSTGAKELSIAPLNSVGVRLNLFESSDLRPDFHYSVVRQAIVSDMGKDWKYGPILFHPFEHKIAWIGGHASPGPLFPRTFIDLGPNKLLGIMNGRVANRRVGKEIKYGTFSIGLFIYDYEKGKIDWVSPKPFIEDSEATTITFASQFVETTPGQGILYAHVDDSFVRAYTLIADDMKPLLPSTAKFVS